MMNKLLGSTAIDKEALLSDGAIITTIDTPTIGQVNGGDKIMRVAKGRPLLLRVDISAMDFTDADETYEIGIGQSADGVNFATPVRKYSITVSASDNVSSGVFLIPFTPSEDYVMFYSMLLGTTPSLTIEEAGFTSLPS